MTSNAFVVTDHPASGVCRLTMNRPEKFNALSGEMLSALQDAFEQASADPQCRVVVLAASGKAFCTGHDLQEMRANPDLNFYKALFAQCTRLMLTIQRLPQPVIAQVQGMATAAGCQLVAMCDLAVASTQARFAVSGIRYGLFCATPSVAISRALPRKQAMEMLLTGDFVDATTAVAQGLINSAVPTDELESCVAGLCASILAKPATAVRMGKELFYRQLELGVEAAYALAGDTMAVNMMAPCAQEGFAAFLEKRSPNWSE